MDEAIEVVDEREEQGGVQNVAERDDQRRVGARDRPAKHICTALHVRIVAVTDSRATSPREGTTLGERTYHGDVAVVGRRLDTLSLLPRLLFFAEPVVAEASHGH